MSDTNKEARAKMLAEAIKIDERVETLSVADCISNWVMVENAIPLYNHKLIIALKEGTVMPGWFNPKAGFSARVHNNKKVDVLPIAWRLYPPPPGREIEPDSTIATIKFFR